MTYMRVIPRDLFNEAGLLKCLGRLFIELDNARQCAAIMGDGDRHGAQDDYSGEPFNIVQCPDSGAIEVDNLAFHVRGTRYRLCRPLNSREAWPLWLEGYDDPDFDAVEVFDTEGHLSSEFRHFIGLEG